MANYDATARSNYFLVKDLDAFKADLAKYGIAVTSWENKNSSDLILDDKGTPAGAVALFASGGWPAFDGFALTERLGIDDEDDLPTDLPHGSISELVGTHLVDGQVAIFTEVGFEKMRYLGGTTVAVNAAGETRRVDLDDIYTLAKDLTHRDTVITLAEA